MTRTTLNNAIAAALFASLALMGCKKKDDATTTMPAATDPAVTTPAPTTPAPTANDITVSSIDLGNAVGADNRISTPLTRFAKSDTIHASVATGGAGGDLTARWTMDGQPVDTQDKMVPPGPQVTEFSISKPDGWPVGRYKLEVMTNGNVLQTREFDVQ